MCSAVHGILPYAPHTYFYTLLLPFDTQVFRQSDHNRTPSDSIQRISAVARTMPRAMRGPWPCNTGQDSQDNSTKVHDALHACVLAVSQPARRSRPHRARTAGTVENMLCPRCSWSSEVIGGHRRSSELTGSALDAAPTHRRHRHSVGKTFLDAAPTHRRHRQKSHRCHRRCRRVPPNAVQCHVLRPRPLRPRV